MKKYTISIFLLGFCLLHSFAQNKYKKNKEVDFVNCYIGTAVKGDGGLALNVGPPFPMTNFSPQTCENRIMRMPYVYEDSTILGFIGSHQPTVWMSDYGYVSVMPEIGSLKTLPEQRKLAFSHKDEVVTPYYYSVKLNAENKKTIKAEMAARERCAILKFTFPESKESHLVFQSLNINDIPDPDWYSTMNSIDYRLKNLKGFIKIDKERNEIVGYNPDRQNVNISPLLKNFKGYFVIQFDKKINSFGVWNNNSIMSQTDSLIDKKRVGAYVSFATRNNETVKVKIATSFISIEQARRNLEKEIPDWNFDKTVAQTRDDWQKTLEKIKIDGVTPEQKTIFYTAFYHTQLFPRQFSEDGKYYSGADDKIHDGISYNDYSLWDTFRALHPFLIFVQPDRVNEMINSMLQMYKESGWLPMWPNPAETNTMIGTHADAVIADAYVKGLRNYDVNLAYEAMRKDAMVATECDGTTNKLEDNQPWGCYEGQAGMQFFHTLGYIPSDYKAESVSRTIEFGIDDYCTAQMAKDLGKTDDYKRLMEWATNYKNLYNKKTGFFAPRLFNGNWDPNPENGFTEGSSWTYLFGAMHDVNGIIETMGGNESFSKMLDRNFAEKNYRHDNEPGHHYIYLYDYCGQPWKTQEQARLQTTINYRNTADGINGNDDCGQMSAWYIFSVMGFYPVTPASGIYAIGAPQFPKITMNYTADGKARQLEIVANHLSEKNKYIQKVTLDGQAIDKPFISHQQIINGSKLVFDMGDKPNYDWK